MELKKLAILIVCIVACNSCKTHNTIIVDNVLEDKTNWVIEQQPGGIVNFGNNKIEIIDAKGCTVWYKNPLEGNIKIAYDVTVIDAGGPFDRVSDVNCFWMAKDPENPDDFFKNSSKRAGKFSNYNTLKLYYVGYGGHDNTKTRFRRYDGNFERPLFPAHDLSDKKFLITANKKMHVEIIVNNNVTSYSRNGEVVFKINDPKPYNEGYFGFRTVNNHMLIENFIVKSLY
jgi:hypothetical protein